MMYSTNMHKIKSKHLIFWARQKMTNFGGLKFTLFTTSDFYFCHF
jgi:hypothetical protein